MKSPGKQRAVGFASKSPAPISANFTPENKLDFIRKGKKRRQSQALKKTKMSLLKTREENL